MLSLIYLQISSGRGPAECQRAVHLFVESLQKEATKKQGPCEVLETSPASRRDCLLSALVRVDKKNFGDLHGSVQWIAQSPFRPNHRRKNWFLSVQVLQVREEHQFKDDELTIEACRASGPGGQHVNTTSSAVRLFYKPLNLTIKASEERSQHRNKSLALARLAKAIAEYNEQGRGESDSASWMNHNTLERGNPVRVYEGPKFHRKL